ncbi:hypothetical protein INR49_027722 [Caranx melampygus]|nr:hypothetical protein INR49_027722 [Caranx melampygus]
MATFVQHKAWENCKLKCNDQQESPYNIKHLVGKDTRGGSGSRERSGSECGDEEAGAEALRKQGNRESFSALADLQEIEAGGLDEQLEVSVSTTAGSGCSYDKEMMRILPSCLSKTAFFAKGQPML